MKKIFFLAVFVLSASLLSAVTLQERQWMQNGIRFYNTEDYDRAIQSFDYVLTINPRNFSALVYLGYSHEAKGNIKKAITYYNRAYAVKNDPRITQRLARIKEKMKKKIKGYLYSGGPSRLAALGGIQVVVPDAAAAADPYAFGFTSFYAFRPQKNVINMSAGFKMPLRKIVVDMGGSNESIYEKNDLDIFLNAEKNKTNNISYWFPDGSAAVITPIFAFSPETHKIENSSTGSYEYTTTALLAAFEAEYAKKINENISIGALAGYGTHRSSASDFPAEGRKRENNFSKFQYLASATYMLPLPGSSYYISAAAGNKSGYNIHAMPSFRTIDTVYQGSGRSFFEQVGAIQESPFVYNHYNRDSVFTYEDGVNKTEIKNSLNMSVFGFSIGTGIEKYGESEAAGSFSVYPVISGRVSGETVITSLDTGESFSIEAESYEVIRDGIEVVMRSMGRYYFDAFIIGLKLDYLNTDYKIYDSADDEYPDDINMNFLNVSAGTALRFIENTLIPVEFFISSGSRKSSGGVETKTEVFEAGCRAGAEYELNSSISLRGGGSFSSRTVSMNNEPAGTPENPDQNKAAFSLGAGYSSDNMEIGASLGYNIIMHSPLGSVITEYSDNEAVLVLDLKFFI